MQLARESAMKAVEDRTKSNKETVKLMKEINKEHQKDRDDKLQEEAGVKKNLMQTVIETKINVEVEKKKMNEKKKKIHDDVEKVSIFSLKLQYVRLL